MAIAGSTGERSDLAALDAAWDDFFSALRRAKGRAALQRGTELTLPQVHLLEPLAGDGRARIGELADAAGVTAPTASRMVDSLERGGIVARADADGDRRVVTVELTEHGAALYERKRAELHAKRLEIFGGLSDAEREQAARLLGRMAKLIDEL